MSTEAETNAFERRYMGAFRALAAKYGIEATHERDRAARDIGLHLTRSRRAGKETTTGSLIWFQMKGIMRDSLTAEQWGGAKEILVRLRVSDLRLWHRMNGPTYLAVYVESVDKFLMLDLVSYIEKNYGRRIHELKQDTVNVAVPTSNVVDDHMFDILRRRGDAAEWARVVEAEATEMRFCQRDYSVIWRLGTAAARRVEHLLEVKDWQSKIRGEVDLLERSCEEGAEWSSVRGHW